MTDQSPNQRPPIQEEEGIINGWLSENGDQSLKTKQAVGRGGFSVCWLLEDIGTGQHVAVLKSLYLDMNRNSEKRSYVRNEIRIHSALSHPNVVQFKRHVLRSPLVFIFLEYCNRGSLDKLIKRGTKRRINSRHCSELASDLISALIYVHGKHIIHRDMKPGNVLVHVDPETGKRQAKLADFGLSIRTLDDAPQKKVCGTPKYIAPEMIRREDGYSYGVDIWGLGILLHVCLFGKTPYPSIEGSNKPDASDKKTKQLIYAAVKSARIEVPQVVESMTQAREFVLACLVVYPKERATAKRLAKHPWIDHQ